MKVTMEQYPMASFSVRSQLNTPPFKEALHESLEKRKRGEQDKGIDLTYLSNVLFQPEMEAFAEQILVTKDIKTFLITKTVAKYLHEHGEKMMEKFWPLYTELADHQACILWNGWTFFYNKFNDTDTNVVITYVIFNGYALDAGVAVVSTDQGIHIGATVNDQVKKLVVLLVGLIVPFLHFAECETKIINSTTNHKAKVNDEKYVTNIPSNIQIVDSNWFTTLIRSGAFGVQGHFRLQPFGVDHKRRRLQWIRAFEKHGYTKRARVEIQREQVV